MLLSDWRCDLVCGADEVLAVTLTNDGTITRRSGGTVTYIHLMFANHEIIFGDGIPSESFHPGAKTLGAMDPGTQAEPCGCSPSWIKTSTASAPRRVQQRNGTKWRRSN